MSRLKKTIRLFNSAVHSVTKRPRLVGNALQQWPPSIEGMQFGQEAAFSTQALTGNDNVDPANPLQSYFDAYKEGPGIWKWMHYFDIYQRHFSKFVGREVHVLEVGIYSGGSLAMWK